ncbi:GNAT family N-acetyltransferase [Thermodesulfobacteriota bacterium]
MTLNENNRAIKLKTHSTTYDEYTNYGEHKAAFQDHMAISSYPLQYEKKVITRTGIEVFIRPIKKGDVSMLIDLFKALSPKTIYYRFFSPLKELSHDMLTRFTQIDYHRDMALVALDQSDSNDKILGVTRYMFNPFQLDTEFAVVVRDEYQGKGIGRALLENLIMIARDKNIERMSGYVLAENIHMLSLARQLGFSLLKIPCENQYILTIDLKKITV